MEIIGQLHTLATLRQGNVILPTQGTIGHASFGLDVELCIRVMVVITGGLRGKKVGLFESAIGLPYLMSLANADAYRHVCFVCGKRYKSRSKLNRHVRYECGGARNQLQCRVCGRRFSRPDNLRQHSYLHTLQKF